MLGEQHIETLWSEFFLAELLRAKGDFREAETWFRHCLMAQRKPGAASPPVDVAGTLASLGDLLTDDGRPAEAEPLLRECLSIQEKELPPGNRWISSTRSILGCALARQGKFAEAEPHLVEGCQALARAKGTPAQEVAKAFNRTIGLYERWGKLEQAEAWRKQRPDSGKQIAMP